MKIATGLVLLLFFYDCGAPPVNEKKKGSKDTEHAENNEVDQQVFDVEYKRYLQEVVNVLESDPDFKDRLLKADPEDIKSGKISKELEFVNHNVRSKLDELKRQELERLRHLAIQQYEMSNGIDKRHMKIPAHIDPKNPHTFETEDLRKLIVQTTKELEDADRQRKDEFKEYEMQKELQYQEQLKHLDETQRKEAETEHKRLSEKHREHKPLHHPGSKQQLEQVWEEQDHLSPEDFNPKTFFHLHDLDGNGVWDANEVKALFKKELDKMYDPNAPEDDIRERFEEMERMREHVFNETDTNKDQLVSYQEFLEQTKRQDFEKDEGWDPIDQQPNFTQDEYKEYARQHEEEIRRMIDQGMAVPGMPQNGIPPQYLHHGQGYPQQGEHGQPMGYHPQGVPPQHQQPGQYHHPNPVAQHQQAGQYQHPPPGQHQQPGQYQHPPPVQHHQQNQFDHQNQQQLHPNAVPQQHHPQGGVQYHPPPNQHYQQAPPMQQHQLHQVPVQQQYQQHAANPSPISHQPGVPVGDSGHPNQPNNIHTNDVNIEHNSINSVDHQQDHSSVPIQPHESNANAAPVAPHQVQPPSH